MLANALIYLISVVCGLYTFALLLRFYLQWVRAPYRNPIAHFVQQLTDTMVKRYAASYLGYGDSISHHCY